VADGVTAATEFVLSHLLPSGRHGGYYRFLEKEEREENIVARSLHAALLERYGEAEGRKIYGKMQAEQKGPFAPGAKYARSSDDQLRDFIRRKGNSSR
jgi:hypothetical protein